jgi:hypothetical protein
MEQQTKQDAEDKLRIVEENESLQKENEKLRQDLVIRVMLLLDHTNECVRIFLNSETLSKLWICHVLYHFSPWPNYVRQKLMKCWGFVVLLLTQHFKEMTKVGHLW